MVAATADQGLSSRLAFLRRRRGHQAFLTEAPTTGRDQTGLVTLEVDASGWVIGSRVAGLERLRRGDEFVAAVMQAYRAAAALRMVANAQERLGGRTPSPEEQERGVAIAEGRIRLEPPPRPHFPRWELPRVPVDDRVAPPSAGPGEWVRTGRSRDGEITVSATVAAGLEEVRVTGDWLTDSSVEAAHYALRDAFDDLREKGAL